MDVSTATCWYNNSYAMLARDVSGLNRNARGPVAPEGGVITDTYTCISSVHLSIMRNFEID